MPASYSLLTDPAGSADTVPGATCSIRSTPPIFMHRLFGYWSAGSPLIVWTIAPRQADVGDGDGGRLVGGLAGVVGGLAGLVGAVVPDVAGGVGTEVGAGADDVLPG